MTIKGLRDGLIQDLAENVYDTYWFGLEGTKMICEALDKQIPKKPINGHPRDYRCPYCYNDVYGDGFYCGICGQALDWGNDDDK